MDLEEILTCISTTGVSIQHNHLPSTKSNLKNSSASDRIKQEKQLKTTSKEETDEWICTNKKKRDSREYCRRVQKSSMWDSIISSNRNRLSKMNIHGRIEFTTLWKPNWPQIITWRIRKINCSKLYTRTCWPNQGVQNTNLFITTSRKSRTERSTSQEFSRGVQLEKTILRPGTQEAIWAHPRAKLQLKCWIRSGTSWD